MVSPEKIEVKIFPKPENGSPPETEIPTGNYKYVRCGPGTLILSLIKPGDKFTLEHKQIVAGNDLFFNLNDDDAGFLHLQRSLTEKVIRDKAQMTVEAFAKQGVVVDPTSYLNQLQKAFGQTKITIGKDGSKSLGYVPNQRARKITDTLLQALFPEAIISEEKT